MPLTEKEISIKNVERVKRWRINNPEKKKEYDRLWREKNREKISKQKKEWCEKNKEKIAEKYKEYQKEYRKTPEGRKSRTISVWKRYGLVSDNYDELYQNYLKSTHCEECGCEYGEKGDGSNQWKCMDHCHTSGLFRNFLCNRCNLMRR